MTLNVSMTTDNRSESGDPSDSTLDVLAIVKANRSAYLALTGNRFSVEFGERTCFDHTNLKVIIGAEQLATLGIREQRELHFIILHELGHLKEFKDDTDSFLSLIRSFNKFPDGEEIFHLYNAVMDIYVNHNTANKAAVFSDGQGGFSDLVKDIYLTKAFPEHDLSGLSLSSQYAINLLLLGMGVARAYTVSEQVRDVFKAGLSFCGKHYGYDQFIETFLVPAIGQQKNDYWQGTIGQRDAVIRATILPIFQELLNRDKANGVPGPQPRQGSGGPLGGDPSKEGPPTPGRGPLVSYPITHSFTPKELETILDSLADLAKQENMTPEDKARKDLHRQATQIAQAAKSRDASDFADRLVRVQPIVHRLVNEFLAIRSESRSHTRALSKYSTEGILDVPEAIRKFGKVQRDPANADVMRVESAAHSIDNSPMNLRLCLLPDVSNSMQPSIDGLKDNVIALAAAVATLCSIHKLQNSGIVSELAIYGFDHMLHEIQDPVPDASLQHVASSYERIMACGGTREFVALEHLSSVLARLASEDRRKGTGRETVNIAISLTDGDTEDPDRTIEAKDALLRHGVKCFGVFLRSKVSNGDTFRTIWGDRGYEISSVDKLPEVIAAIRARITR
jgi:hypothetical protein